MHASLRGFTVLWPCPCCCLQYGLPPPKLRKPLPRTITFQRKRANRRVVNEAELLSMLSEFGEVGATGVWELGT